MYKQDNNNKSEAIRIKNVSAAQKNVILLNFTLL